MVKSLSVKHVSSCFDFVRDFQFLNFLNRMMNEFALIATVSWDGSGKLIDGGVVNLSLKLMIMFKLYDNEEKKLCSIILLNSTFSSKY